MFSRFVVSQVKHNSYFLVGVLVGLWVALVAVPLEEGEAACAAGGARAEADEWEPRREQRPLGAAGPAADRALQRPRYYTTELGIRGSLMMGILSSDSTLSARAAALNATAWRLQPLKVFVAGAPPSTSPPHPNLVGFTDSREMLKPFHALKYLADNYLDEYNFFFLVSDSTFVNARRLQELVSKLSVSQDVYMGISADDDSHYCTLEGGILLSSSVVRAMHGELDWCVRNSYSAHHHENLGRCVLHAAHTRCRTHLQGEEFRSVRVGAGGGPAAGLSAAVSAAPLAHPRHFHSLHAYLSRLYLEQDAAEIRQSRRQMAELGPRLPPPLRRAGWPPGLRLTPGLRDPPDSRFDHLRWTSFNATHAFLPDDQHAATPLAGNTKLALDMVIKTATAWAVNRWGGASREAGRDVQVGVVEGAWRWEPPHALRYQLLLRIMPMGAVRRVEVCRALGAARLVAAPYVTESARLALVVPVLLHAHPAHPASPAHPAHLNFTREDFADDEPLAEALDFLRRYEAVAIQQDKNTELIMVVSAEGGAEWQAEELQRACADLAARAHSAVRVLQTPPPDTAHPQWEGVWRRAALRAGGAGVSPHRALLLLPARAHFSRDFLNRARMNTIMGVQWFWAGGFERYPTPASASAPPPAGGAPPPGGAAPPPGGAAPPPAATPPPATRSGRYHMHSAAGLAVYKQDFEYAESVWAGGAGGAGGEGAALEAVLAAARRAVRAPEPGLLLQPRRPCPEWAGGADGAGVCARALRSRGWAGAALGERHTLARLVLEAGLYE